MIRVSRILTIVAAAALVASPALATGPLSNRPPPPKPPMTKPAQPNSPATARVNIMKQRVVAARATARSAQAAYFGAIQAANALRRKHAPLLRERNRQQAAFVAESKNINQAIAEKRPGIGKMQADWNARKAIYDANFKAPAVKALEEIAAADKAVALKRWEFKSATDSVADAIGDRTRARLDAKKAAEIRAIERDFPAVSSAMATFNPRPPRTPVQPEVVAADAPITSAPVVAPPTPSADDKAARAKAALERAKANVAARNAQAAADPSDVSTSANPVTPVGQSAASSSSNPPSSTGVQAGGAPKQPVNPVFQRLPQAPVNYGQLLPSYRNVPPGTQKPAGQ